MMHSQQNIKFDQHRGYIILALSIKFAKKHVLYEQDIGQRRTARETVRNTTQLNYTHEISMANII
jgi:hypothetical protein